MMRSSIRRSVCSLLIAFALLLGVVPTASAATAPTPGGNGLRVSPVRTDLIISPGETKVVTINVTNVTSAPGTFQTVVNDFVADPNESGNPAIIFNSTEFAPTHSLKRYVGPVTRFTLAPGQQQGIPITIKVPANAAGGGYYGAIRFAPAGASLSRKQQVNLAGSVGSLILVKVPGNITNKLAIASFDARTRDRASSFFTSSKNIDATVRFQNQGNIQEQPFGKVLLRDRSGKILNSFEINATNPPGNVLPDSIRKFSIPVNKVGKFGKFKLEGNFGYGTSGQLLSGSTTFYVIPSWMILTFVGVVLFLVFLIFGVPRLVRAYNQRVLRRAGRR